MWFTFGLTVVLLVTTLGLLPQLFAVSSDPDFARVAGLRVRVYNLLIAVLAAVTVTVAMRTVGLLLVSALMVVPVATAQQLARSFRTTLAGAMVVGVPRGRRRPAAQRGAVRSGATVAPGPTIVLLALAMFASTWPIGVWLRRRRRMLAPVPRASRWPRTPSPTSTPTTTARTAATRRVPHGGPRRLRPRRPPARRTRRAL